MVGEESGVLSYPSEQCGCTGVLPRQPNGVQARHRRHTTFLLDAALVVPQARYVDPGVVHPIAGGPQHRIDLRTLAALEGRRASLGTGQPRPDRHPQLAEIAESASDNDIA